MIRFMVRFCFLMSASLAALFLPGCGSDTKNIRIGIDPNWYPQNFQSQEAYVNGFVDELLLEISKHSNIEFQRFGMSWDNLTDALRHHRVDAVLSSMPPHNFNRAKYDFSRNFLDIGPVLVIHANAKVQELKEMSNRVIGLLTIDQQLLIMQNYPDILIRNYDLPSDALSALMNHEVECVIMDRLTAVGFLRGTYAGKLKIAGSPLSEAGLHFMMIKDANPEAIKAFNKSIRYLVKKNKLQKLLQKWQLDTI